MLDYDASESEKMIYEICDYIVEFKHDNNLNNEEIANLLEVNSAKLKEIYDHRYDRLTLDELIKYTENLTTSEKVRLSNYFQVEAISEEQEYQTITQ